MKILRGGELDPEGNPGGDRSGGKALAIFQYFRQSACQLAG